jgi:membrane-bound ClpP family serine protease
MPPQPQITGVTQPEGPPGIIGVPATFFSSMLTSLLYGIVLIILELKMVVRDGVLIVTTTLMPISGVLFAFSITRGWGVMLYRSFFGWLFGQPIFAPAGMGAGSMFGLAGLLFLFRRAQQATSSLRSGAGTAAAPPSSAPAVQPASYGGTGSGTAATGRPWRPAYGMA